MPTGCFQGCITVYEWYRQRYDDRWGDYILHKDWILGDEVQFSWREKRYWDHDTDKYDEPVYEIFVRRKEYILGFGIGCSDWYLLYRIDTFNDTCKKLNEIVNENESKKWIEIIRDIDATKIRDEKQKLEKKFCGHSSKGAIGFGYDR